MVLDTVDGKLARCTIRSSRFGDLLDHSTDILHPPFWWWAWWHGLAGEQANVAPELTSAALMVILIGYVAQRTTEAAFILRFGFQIHLWRQFDSRWKLITSQRNINVLILSIALALSLADLGLIVMALWTVLSVAVHASRLLLALVAERRGTLVRSWLETVSQ
jgi:phosphatidylglycerophosphate synthase